MTTATSNRPNLGVYWGISYGLMLFNLFPLLVWSDVGWLAGLFQTLVYLSYGLLYLLPAILVTECIAKFFRLPLWFVAGIAIVGVGSIQTLLYADRTIYGIFDFHINGFVWNLVTTPGGIASMGADTASTLSFAAIVGLIYCLQAVAWYTARRVTSRITT